MKRPACVVRLPASDACNLDLLAETRFAEKIGVDGSACRSGVARAAPDQPEFASLAGGVAGHAGASGVVGLADIAAVDAADVAGNISGVAGGDFQGEPITAAATTACRGLGPGTSWRLAIAHRTVTVHVVCVPLQAPLQPAKLLPLSALALSATAVLAT